LGYCLRIDLMETLGLGHSVASGFITQVHKQSARQHAFMPVVMPAI
jgi:hypothetical protein